MLEAEYKRRFRLISDEITSATRAFYTEIEIQKFAHESNENSQKINRDGHFWSLQLHALQTTWFIILGRIFDRDDNSYSIHYFLKSTLANKALFSKRTLAERKRKAAAQPEPEWPNDYLESSHEPTIDDLKNIQSIVEESNTKWDARYKKIRHKVFAHTDKKAAIGELFRNTTNKDIEDILHNLNKIRTAVFRLLEYDGVYWITDDNRRYAEPAITDVRNILSRL